MCRRKLSFTAAEIRLIAFGTNLLQHRVRCRSGQGMPDPKHPHAMFPCEGPGPTHGTQSYLFADCLHIQSVARFQVQLLAGDFGITTRPALSMVRRTFIMAWYDGWTQQSMPFATF